MKGDYIVEEKIGLLEGNILLLEERILRLEHAFKILRDDLILVKRKALTAQK